MEPYQQRKHDLEEHIKEEFRLLNEYETEWRLAEDPQQKQKLKKRMQEVQDRVNYFNVEFESLSQTQHNQYSLVSAMTNITFTELDTVTKGIIGMPIPPDINFSLTNPLQKMFNNQITEPAKSRLMTGLIKSTMVSKFVDNMVNVNPDFPESLKVGFVTEYQRLQAIGLEGNALFYALDEFSCNGSSDYDLKAAGLAVLYYLFEKCEVFER